MVQIETIPTFRGDGTEDVEGWLHGFVMATGHFSDSGTFRFLSTRLEGHSPAREWYDGLDDNEKVSWMPFERLFRSRWISSPEKRTQPRDAWDDFQKHTLSSEYILDGASASITARIDDKVSWPRILTWVQKHRELGQAAHQDDHLLIETTRVLLPPFIRAHIDVTCGFQFSSFEELCAFIEGIPAVVVKMEYARQREASSEWREMVEKRLNDISDKVDRILGLDLGAMHRQSGYSQADRSENETCLREFPDAPSDNVPEELCLASTTNLSLLQSSSSEVATPVTPLEALPATIAKDITDALELSENWRKPEPTLTHNQMTAVAKQLIQYISAFSLKPDCPDRMVGGTILPPHHWESFAATLSVSNRVTRNITSYHSKVKEVLSASRIFGALDPSQNFYHWKDSVWRGLAMIYGYRAYSDPHLIIAATTCWTDAANRIIKPDQYVVNGYPALQTSDGKVVYAGCHLGYNSEFSVRSVETVLYMLLSAHLAECTNYDEYKEIALQTAERVKTIMWDSQCKLVKDLYINVGSSYGDTIKLPMSCYATGLFIEGLCVLASITGDGTWTELMIEVATAAIRWPNWHSSEGILIAGSGSKASLTSDDQAFRGILLRSLVEAYRRNPSNNAFRSLIKAYINVQFNAIYELARRENVFGVDWRGPFKGPFLHAQLAALDVIVAAIAVNDLDG